MKFHVYKNREELAEELALWICDLINFTLQSQEFFTFVLSGGETPKILFKKLASPEYKKKLAGKGYIFFGAMNGLCLLTMKGTTQKWLTKY